MKKVFSILIFTLMILAVLPLSAMDAEAASIVDSGECGDNLTWTLDSDGLLTISGTGDMTNWDWFSDVPWYNNGNIKNVVIENGATSIEDYAFYYCDSLTSITIPNSVTSIGGYAFSGCSSLKTITIPNGVINIYYSAFQNCTSLTSITISNSVTSIGADAFRNCPSLTTIIVDEDNKNYSSIDGVLYNKNATVLYHYPIGRNAQHYSIPNNVTDIGYRAFENCTSLTSITTPDSLTTIGSVAFSGCESLENITIPSSVTSIGSSAFYHCTSLKGIAIPNGVTSIDEWTFGDCTSLTSVTIGSGVTYIGNRAFDSCTSLKAITIPNSVTRTGESVFDTCTSLTSVTFGGDIIIGYDSFDNCNKLTDIYFKGTTKQWSDINFDTIWGIDIDSVTIHFPTLLKITKQPVNTSAVIGNSAKFTIEATGDGLTYTWYFKNPGAAEFTKSAIKTSAYSVSMQKSLAGRQVYCVVGDEYGNTVQSDTVTLSLYDLKITTQPKTTYAKLSETAKVTVAANGDGLKYAWYFKNTGSTTYTKSAITSSTYNVAMQKSISGREVYCVVTDKYGNTAKSNAIKLYLSATITKQPTNATAAIGSKATASVTAAGDGLTYTWYFKNPGAADFTKSGITSSTYSMTMQQSLSGRQVYCVVTDKYGNTAKSNTVTLSAAAAVKITTQPKTTYTKVGASAKLTVAASGEGLKYTWYFKNPTASEFTKSGITSSTYSATMQKSLSGRQVYCVVTDKYGNSVKSNTVYLYLSASITKQPTDTIAAVGEKAKVSVTAAGDGLTYTWYFKNPTASEFTKSGITSSTYSMTMQKSLSGRQVYCVVTDKYGETVTSDTVTITAQ